MENQVVVSPEKYGLDVEKANHYSEIQWVQRVGEKIVG